MYKKTSILTITNTKLFNCFREQNCVTKIEVNGIDCLDEGYHLRPTNLHLSFYYINKSDSAGFFLSAFLRRPVCRLHEMFPFYLPHCAICIVYCITKIMLCIIAKPVECWSVPIFCSMSSFCKHLYICYENKIAMLFSRVE